MRLRTTFFLMLVSLGAQAAEVPTTGFAQVTPFLYRGARPTMDGIRALRQMGIKTDLNIDNDDDAIWREKAWAKGQGLQFISIPLSSFFKPSDETINRIFKVIHDPSNYPIYLHCKHGEDRTGMIVGLYRYFDEHWSANDAYYEMLVYGFHPFLLGLDHYFKEKTGLDPIVIQAH